MTDHDDGDALEVDASEVQATDETVDDKDAQVATEGNDNGTNTGENDSSTDQDGTEDESGADEADVDDDADATVPLSKLKEVRREAKNLRDRLRTAEARITELEATPVDQSIIDERDQLRTQVETLTKQARHSTLSNLVTATAQEAGAIQPDAIVHLIDVDAVEWEDGKPKNVADLVKEAKAKYSRLFTTGNGNAGNRNERGGEYEGMTAHDRIRSALNG